MESGPPKISLRRQFQVKISASETSHVQEIMRCGCTMIAVIHDIERDGSRAMGFKKKLYAAGLAVAKVGCRQRLPAAQPALPAHLPACFRPAFSVRNGTLATAVFKDAIG